MSNKSLYLIKPGELTLKGGNRAMFENTLKRNIKILLKGSGAQLSPSRGRMYISCDAEAEPRVEDALRHLFGISGWAKSRVCEKNRESLLKACVEEAKILFEKGIRSFKIEARRSDKSFALNSYGICCAAGEAVIAAFPGLKVDVHKPEGIIEVEVRSRVYVYGQTEEGLRGLPVGTAGRGLLLLSGGIDSPVAAYMMAARGMRLEAVYFHAYPYTSGEALSKTVRLAEVLGRYTLGINIFIINFTPLQIRIRERSPEAWRTVLLRMAMMETAEKLALKRGDKCLITGESLSQVASQTVENIACTQSLVSIPVLRPLIGMNKEQIIRTAEKISTYKTSILPYEDCCALFTPPHPVLHGSLSEARELYGQLDSSSLIEEALSAAEMKRA